MSTRHGVDRREALTQKQPRLLALPGNPYVTLDRLEVAVASLLIRALIWTTIRCQHTQVRNTLTVVADPERVRALNEQGGVSHPRSYSKDAQIEEPTHIAKLVERKAQVYVQ